MNDATVPANAADLEAEVSRLKSENDRLRRFVEIGKILNTERRIHGLIPPVVAEIRKCLRADRGTLFLIDLDRSEVTARYGEGLNDQVIRIQLKMGIVGLCVLTRKVLNVMEAGEDVFFYRESDKNSGYHTQSVLCAPFFDPQGEAIGAIQLLNKNSGLFTKHDENLIQGACLLLSDQMKTAEITKDYAEPLIATLREAAQCERGSLFLLDRKEMKLNSLVAEGLVGPVIQLNLKLGIAGYVAVTGEEVIINDAYSDPRAASIGADKETGYRTRNMVCLPIKNLSGDVLGVIQVLNKNEGVFDDADLELLRAITPQIAIAIENAILLEEQNQQWRSFLEVLAASIDAKDPLTAGHSHKVAEYAVGIAVELGLSEAERDILHVAALLHDYGKIGVSDAVLKKPGKLTPEEFAHIKTHIPATRSILGRMHFMRKYRNLPLIASCHHERLDGSGYSEGLQDHEIPFMSKILAVADVFEALTAKRHYRDALGVEEAFKILDQDVGTKYDGHIVEALKSYWSRTSATTKSPSYQE